jgi:hypothetical protein
LLTSEPILQASRIGLACLSSWEQCPSSRLRNRKSGYSPQSGNLQSHQIIKALCYDCYLPKATSRIESDRTVYHLLLILIRFNLIPPEKVCPFPLALLPDQGRMGGLY